MRPRPHAPERFAAATRELVQARSGLREFVVLEVWTAVIVRYVRVA